MLGSPLIIGAVATRENAMHIATTGIAILTVSFLTWVTNKVIKALTKNPDTATVEVVEPAKA